MTFLVTYRNYFEGVAVHAFADGLDAKAWLEAQTDQAISGRIISGPLDIDGSKKYMVDLFNALAREGDEVLGSTGFNNRATGQTRVFDRLTMYYSTLPITTAPTSTSTPTPESTASNHSTSEAESSPSEHQEQETDMAKAKTKKTKAPKKAKRVKKERVTKTPRVKGELRPGTIAAEVAKIWGREKGGSKAETLAIIAPKFPDKEMTALDNTVRGYVNSLPAACGKKLRKEKDEKRGLVYYLV